MTRFLFTKWIRRGWPRIGLLAACLFMLLAAHRLFGGSMNQQQAKVRATAVSGAAILGTTVTSPDLTDGRTAVDSARTFPVRINPVTPPGGVLTERVDYHGTSVTIACRTCHAIRPANPANRAASDVNEFHQQLKYQHGQLACVACHDANDSYQSLHLADGTSVAYADTMKLCAQCHGTQFRDYQHGSHGGMTGYWDLTRGPRQRNHCIDCHDPHAPAFPVVHPAAGPRDRFSPASRDSQHE